MCTIENILWNLDHKELQRVFLCAICLVKLRAKNGIAELHHIFFGLYHHTTKCRQCSVEQFLHIRFSLNIFCWREKGCACKGQNGFFVPLNMVPPTLYKCKHYLHISALHYFLRHLQWIVNLWYYTQFFILLYNNIKLM